MNRNTSASFAEAPQVDIQRSKMTISQRTWTTFNTGKVVPLFTYLDILPGDTFSASYTGVVRQSTALHPTMDDAYFDIYAFTVPWRIIWKHLKEFMGENTNGAWTQQTEYLIPQLTTPEGGASKGTLMDYMGIRTGIKGIKFSAMGVRAYTFIINEFFRDQNLIAPLTQYDDDTDREASNSVTELGGEPFTAAKFHDYFTSCLPEPQKGEAVTLPIGSTAPVQVFGSGKGLALWDGSQQSYLVGTSQKDVIQVLPNDPFPNDTGVQFTNQTNVTLDDRIIGINPSSNIDSGLKGIADLSQAVAATINAQRQAFAIQRILEKDARGGTRYREVIRSHFLTTPMLGVQQVPEYLGGERLPLQMMTVAQTSQGTETSPQGNLTAFGHTTMGKHLFTKSFTEHCVLMILGVVRTKHSYSQGLNRMWSRRRRYDLYWPSLANLGEQAVLNKEIFVQGNATDEETFGFQERWAEYRHFPDLVTGEFRPDYAQSLDSWLYTDDYDSLPVLSKEWISEPLSNMDRTLAVTSKVSDQFIANFRFEFDAARPMALHSIPGLLDHY